MTDQLSLLDTHEIVTPAHTPGQTLDQRFDAFHQANQWVYEALESLTADEVARGHQRIGIAMLFEVLRWHYGRQTHGDAFRLNNDYRSRYARLLMQNNPEWDGIFATRALPSERAA